jgi:two-component system chemotaxis response regulator CheY
MPRLLVVDDSPAMHRLVARIIDQAGLNLECTCSGSGTEALEMLRRSGADLILTDINMPRMDGEELIRILRGDAALREIPVIVMSTDGTRARIARLSAAGIQGYLIKPFTSEMLCKELSKVLGGAHD